MDLAVNSYLGHFKNSWLIDWLIDTARRLRIGRVYHLCMHRVAKKNEKNNRQQVRPHSASLSVPECSMLWLRFRGTPSGISAAPSFLVVFFCQFGRWQSATKMLHSRQDHVLLVWRRTVLSSDATICRAAFQLFAFPIACVKRLLEYFPRLSPFIRSKLTV